MFSRSIQLLGECGLERLKNSHIVLCGCGGVGSYTFEALIRTGVGKITLIDSDRVEASNINRQLIALQTNIGMLKTQAAKSRALSINPQAVIVTKEEHLTRENIADIIPGDADYIIDAIDSVPAKTGLAEFAAKHNIPIISCLGTGKRLDATKFEICDIFETEGCPLARKMRYELKKAGVKKLTVLFSKAPVIKTDGIGSVAFVPSVAGLLIAQKVICDITGENK